MRKFLISVLLATTAAAVTTPAVAQRSDPNARAEEREERRKEREAARKERSEARDSRSEAREAPPERVEQRQEARQQNIDARQQAGDRRAANVNERGGPALDQQRRQVREAATQRQQQRDQARQERVDSRERWVQQAERARRVTPPAGARPDRPAPPPPTASNHRGPTWSSTHWRRDSRYDWRRWRDRNRSLFRLGFYFDPFGWNYRRYNIGWRLWPSYYSDNYWLNDPWSYRLPYAPWPYRWIRYYDDAILVNTMTGQVADVIYDFFW